MPNSQAATERVREGRVTPLKAKHVTVRCDGDLLAVLGALARDSKAPISAVVRAAILAYRKSQPPASEAVPLIGALIMAIDDDEVCDRFLRNLKLGDELNQRLGNAPSESVKALTTALTAPGSALTGAN